MTSFNLPARARSLSRMLFALLCWIFSMQELAAAESWTTPDDNEIPLGASAGIGSFLSPVYDPGSSQLVLIWQDSDVSTNLYYATYDGTSWTAPDDNGIPLGDSAGVDNFFTPVYHVSASQLVVVWRDSDTSTDLYYASYDGTSWSTSESNQIPLGDSTGVYSNSPLLVYDPTTSTPGQLVLIWQDNGTPGEFFYAYYNGTSWTGPDGNELPLGNSTGVSTPLLTPVYDTTAEQLVQVWKDNDSRLYYASYDGTSWTAPEGNEIPLGDSEGIANPLAPAYDTATSQLIQVWQDSGYTNFYYAAYNGTDWAAEDNEIATGAASAGVAGIFSPVYDTTANQLVLMWHGNTNQQLYYASYDESGWTVPTSNAIPLGSSEAINYDDSFSPTLVNDSTLSQLVVVWQDNDNTNLYYAYYEGAGWTAPSSGNANLLPLGNSTGVSTPLAPVYNTTADQLVQIWQDVDTNRFYYAYYFGSSSPQAFRRPNNRRS